MFFLQSSWHVPASDAFSNISFTGKIRDKQNRRPDHPDYDARTVKVPDSVMLRLSGTQKEYWKIKQDYMDIVLFFKVGSFYELYELDAEIGIKEFGWKLTLSGVGKCRQVRASLAWIGNIKMAFTEDSASRLAVNKKAGN